VIWPMRSRQLSADWKQENYMKKLLAIIALTIVPGAQSLASAANAARTHRSLHLRRISMQPVGANAGRLVRLHRLAGASADTCTLRPSLRRARRVAVVKPENSSKAPQYDPRSDERVHAAADAGKIWQGRTNDSKVEQAGGGQLTYDIEENTLRRYRRHNSRAMG
jgi:hypothetical protein